MKTKSTHPAILAVADTVEKLRACDVGRVYDTALYMSMDDLNEVKAELKNLNPSAYEAMQNYEAEEMEVCHHQTISTITKL
jgi:hypothetical protein